MRLPFALAVVLQCLLLVFAQDVMGPEGRTPQPDRTPSPIELATPRPGETVYQVISRIPQLSEFTNLVDQTGFRFFLDNPYSRVTVFVPTDEAFEMFRQRQGDEGDQQSQEQNVQLVAYHIGTPSRSLDALENNELFFTSGGLPVRINRYGEDSMLVTVNGALVQDELSAANGQIVIIDQVLTPPNVTLFELLQQREDFSMFAQLVQESDQDVMNRLMDPSASLTLFVPSNQAFENQDISLEDQQQISDFVRRFISDDVLYSIALFDGRSIQTESGESLQIGIQENRILLGEAPIQEVDINTVNGVAHVLNQIPAMATQMPETPQGTM